MNKGLPSLCIVIAILCCTLTVAAQQKLANHSILIRNQKLVPFPNARIWFDSIAVSHKASDTLHVLLQFEQLPNGVQKNQLKSSGVFLLDYIPNNTFRAIITGTLTNIPVSSIRSVVPLKTEWKIDERILKTFNLQSPKSRKILVSFIQGYYNSSEAEQYAIRYGGRVTAKKFESLGSFEIELPQNRVKDLAQEPVVKYIGQPAENTPLNYDAAASSGALLLHSAPGGGLDGTGVTIGVGDNASGIVHVDVRDRLINFNPDEISMHGVHTTLTAAGKGIMDPRTIGMAPNVRVLAHIYDAVWASTESMFKDFNMTITNNSYTANADLGFSGTYDQYSQMLDDLAKQFPLVQHVFASGNSGLSTYQSFPSAYHTVNGGYQASKNVLTVGALAKDNIVWPKSSRGPVMDGRLKPEIVGYGFGIFSGDILDNYGNSNGTSMSCPVVTGCLALLEQRYKQLHGNLNAPSNVLKAIIMNGATDIGNPGPDYTHGYGLVNVFRSKQILDSNWYLVDSVNNSGLKTHSFMVPANTAQVKVMLYWHDESASPLSSTTLVNNLDMEVTGAGGPYKPRVLDTNASGVANTAVQGVDNLNNSEQIIIDNPSGSYTVSIQGSSIPSGRQEYVVVYDFIPRQIKIKQPVSGLAIPGNDSIRIYWDAPDDPNTFTVEFSSTGGSSWSTIASNIAADQRQLVWYTPNISTTQARIRVKRNTTNQQDETSNFIINAQPVVQLSANQCPGYIAIEWNNVANAAGYEILKKMGADLQPVDTVLPATNNSYVFTGLASDTMYYVGVRPLFAGGAGFRSKSVKRMPFDGNCSGNISDGDLKADSLVGPGSGRRFTSTELTSNEMLSLRIRNLDDQAANNYKVSFSLNGGPWQSQNVTTTIPSLAYHNVNFPGLDLSSAGVYEIRVAVENLSIADPVKQNDTLIRYIRNLNNDPVNLSNGFLDDFESAASVSVTKDSMGVLPNEHWDFANTNDTGRLRSFVSSAVLIGGQRSISLDQIFNIGGGWLNKAASQNNFTGTFNLQAYDTSSTEARIEFEYKIHGQPKTLAGNEVWVRGNDAAQWIKIFTFDTSAVPGVTIKSGSLSVTKAFTDSLQNFSSSMQVRFAQYDTSCIAMNEYGNGITFDNFKLYSVKNDVQLLSVVSPEKAGCGLVGSIPLQLLVYNSDNLPQDSIQMNYRLDNGPVISEMLPFIAAKDTVYFTFQTQLSNLTTGYHTLDIWLVNQGDSYLPNDSIINFQFRNQPMVDVFPYLETFETTDGDWYSEGQNSSWEYGEPASLHVKKAANGTKVWATGLTGNYNNNEKSYLYSPCFDISGLTWPTLSFSLSTDIENCGNDLCDAAYLEYSEDGKTWTRLGANGEGTNWYGGLGVWNDTNKIRWKVASIPLPYGLTSLKLRFVMASDVGASREGITIDDIHIFDLKNAIYEGGTTAVNGLVNGNNTVEFTSGGKILATIVPQGTRLGNTEVTMYNHDYVFNPVVQAYHLGRNYVIQPSEATADSVVVRLFITDAEVVKLLGDNACDTCSRAEDAYRMGITKYDNDNNALENGALSDNVGGTYSFLPYTTIAWVPYDNGYYAEFTVTSFSEFWFNTIIPTKKFAGPIIFPNPIRDGKINVVWNAAPGTEMQLMMMDVAGKVVYRSSITASDFDNRTTVQLPELSTGLYLLRYILGEQTQDLKVQVMR